MAIQRRSYRLIELFALTLVAATLTATVRLLDFPPAAMVIVALVAVAAWLREALRPVTMDPADQQPLREQVAAWQRLRDR